ncbi:lipopolysaccharide biosynthesis protein [Flavobacterium soli]|uniref:lipopolysaccharide biosynthesis protein n=1 Tax=Flavobacterium soli TaxID=344881 RepID=UPI0003FCD1DB|nr:lipopolysaccharide biosynthesis protein [Flavobacterium soli]
MLIKKVFGKFSNKFLVYGLGQAFNLVTPVLIAPYLIYVCNLDGFGKIGIAFSFALFFILIVDYGFDIKGIKKISESRNNPEQLEHELVSTLYTKFFLFIISATIAAVCVFLFPYFHNEIKLFSFSLMIVFAQVFNPVWFLQGLENFYISSVVNACSKVIYVILIFATIKVVDDYIYVNLFLGLSSLIVNIVGLIFIFRKNNFKLLPVDFNLIFETLKNDSSLCISQLFLSIRQLSPLFIVGYFFGFTLAGQYKIVDQVISLYRTFSQVFLKFFYPQLCFRLIENKQEAITYWKRYVAVLFSGVFFSALILFFFSQNVLFFFRVEVNVMEHLQRTFQMALIIPIAMVFSLSLEQLMFGFHNNKIYFKITIFVTIFNLVTILLFSKFFDLSGVIVSVFLSEVVFVYLYYQTVFQKDSKQ